MKRLLFLLLLIPLFATGCALQRLRVFPKESEFVVEPYTPPATTLGASPWTVFIEPFTGMIIDVVRAREETYRELGAQNRGIKLFERKSWFDLQMKEEKE